jgi:polysaccharide transporter, PST family
MINNFVIVKIIAIYVGPSGLAFIGQFQNFMSILTTFASGAINSGVVKYTAEFHDDEKEKQKLWSTALRISLGATFFIALILVVSPNYWSTLFFKTDRYSSIFLVFSATLVFFVLNALLLAILNGQKEIKKLVTINIVSSFVGLVLTGTLAYYFNLYGALLSYTIGQALVFFITLGFVLKSPWFKAQYFTNKLDRVYSKKLGKYAAMTIVSALTVSLSQILVRNYIGESISWDDAGYWEGVWKISTAYLAIVTTTLSIYYLPKLSEITNNIELRKEIFYGYKIILPVVIILAIGVYFLRDFVILVIFTDDFMPMSDLFLYQLIGDVFKIASWLLGYLMVAKAMTKIFIVTEIVFSLSFVLLSVVFINWYGLVGVTMAFAVNYFLYLSAMLFIFRNLLRSGHE